MTACTALNALKDFEVQECLQESDVAKGTCLVSKLTYYEPFENHEMNSNVKSAYRFQGKEGQGIVMLKRQHLPITVLECTSFIASLKTTEVFNNDIYSKYAATPEKEHSGITVDIIHPCTAKHISKYSQQKKLIVQETPAMYEEITRPYILALPEGATAWVYNILEKKKEVERLLFEDPDPEVGFMLHPDLKWDQKQISKLYCLAIVHRRDLASLRDLRTEHLPLLRNVLHKGLQAIQSRFGIPENEILVFLHYLPSYYHLHVHFVHADAEPTHGTQAGKAHMLTDVISAIEVSGDYYSRATLACAMGQNDPLYAKLVGKGVKRDRSDSRGVGRGLPQDVVPQGKWPGK